MGKTQKDTHRHEGAAARAAADRDAMSAASDTSWAPWWIADADDKRPARLNIISHLLSQIPYQPPDLPLRHIPIPF